MNEEKIEIIIRDTIDGFINGIRTGELGRELMEPVKTMRILEMLRDALIKKIKEND